jgi:hypothetical protein
MKVQTARDLYAEESFMETLHKLLTSDTVRQPQLSVVHNDHPEQSEKDDMDIIFSAMIY